MLDTQVRVRMKKNMVDVLNYLSEMYGKDKSKMIRELITWLLASEKRKGVIKYNKITEKWSCSDEYLR